MSTKPLMLDSALKIDASAADDGMSRQWRREKEQLEQEVRMLRAQLEEEKARNRKLSRAMEILRQVLSPLHRSLRALFGEIELAVGEEEFSASSTATASQAQGVDPRWESYKQNFPGAPARVIDALLSHREMTITQLSALLKAHYDTVKGAVAKLVKAGAVSRQGGVCQLNR